MKRNDFDDFPDTVIIGSSALYPLAKGAIQMLILLLLLLKINAIAYKHNNIVDFTYQFAKFVSQHQCVLTLKFGQISNETLIFSMSVTMSTTQN